MKQQVGILGKFEGKCKGMRENVKEKGKIEMNISEKKSKGK